MNSVAFFAPLRETPFVRDSFLKAVRANQAAFNLDLPKNTMGTLADYYELIQSHNSLLHLVAPCSPEKFAVRHILESLFLLGFLPVNAYIADVGAGAGLPSIPCLIARKDIRAVLIESKAKKTNFLREAIEKLGLVDRAYIANRQFEEVNPAEIGFVTCRALERFTERLRSLVKWAGQRDLFLFGGNNLRQALEKKNVSFAEKLLPLSQQRFLFIVRR